MFSCEFSEIFKNTYFPRTPPVAAFEKLKAEAVVRRCSVKKVFLNSLGNTCTRVSFFTAFPAGIFLLKVNNRSTRTKCEICSKLKITELTLSSRKSLSYTANQCTVFYMIETSVMKELTFSIPPKTENLLIGYRKAEIS